MLIDPREANPFDDVLDKRVMPVSRRAWLRAAGLGFGSMSLAALLAQESMAGESQTLQEGFDPKNPLAARSPHFAPKAKRVIFLFMHGGPSSIDTFDPKDRLERDNGKPLPIKRPLAFDRSEPGPLMKSPWKFRPGGKSGNPVSDLFPNVRDCVDDMCIIRSMVGEGVDHGAALLGVITLAQLGQFKKGNHRERPSPAPCYGVLFSGASGDFRPS